MPGPHRVTLWMTKCLSVLRLPHTYSEHEAEPFFVDLLGELNKVPVRTYMPGTENTQEFVDYC